MEELQQQNKLLAGQITQLRDAINQLQTRLEQRPAAPPPPAPPRRKCPIALPEKFTGKAAEFEAFLAQCQLFLQARQEDFYNDLTKTAFVLSLLTGPAAKWATPLLRQNSPLLANFQGFVAEMRGMWGDPVQAETANRGIRRLQQGKGSVASYTTDFRLLAQDLAWNDAALQDQYRAGLSDEILDELARSTPPATLPALIEQSLRIDGRLETRRQARRDRTARPPDQHTHPVVVTPVLPSVDPGSMEEPMQLGGARPWLTPGEKKRRRQAGLCLYCGTLGHFARTCPVKGLGPVLQGKRQPPGLNGLLSLGEGVLGSSRLPTEPRRDPLLVAATLQTEGHAIQVGAMIDSGASNNFMDLAFATQHQVPLQLLGESRPVETIDGRLLRSGPVTHQTSLMTLEIQGHVERVQFYIAAVPHFPLVLGMPWLSRHDPHISWSRREVLFASKYCQENCWPEHLSAASEPDSTTYPVVLPDKYAAYADVFDKKEADRLPPHRRYDCAIDLIPGAPIPAGRLYSLSEPELAALRDFLDKNLARGFIRPSTSPAGAPVLFVRKKCGELRLCNDYRALNRITTRNRYPLPLIPELLERLRHARVFTKLDLRGAYNLVRIRAGDEWKTAFQTRYGHYEYTVMPFGLCNAPAVFQHLVNDVFRDYLDRFVIIYLDDFLIYSPTQAVHDAHVKAVLHRLREHGLYAKLEKCAFDLAEVEFLGYRVSEKGIEMDPAKVEAVLAWQAPRTRKEVQRFLGFANYYRRFIPDFANLAAPVTHLLRGKNPFRWTPAAQQAFEHLKRQFTSEPILQHPDPRTPFIVEADASDVAIGAVLLQPASAGPHLLPCAFYSRQLTAPERNYTIWERELLAIKAAFEAWRHLLEGAAHPVEVRTDHRNLEYLQTARKLTQRQKRWSLFFARFSFRLTYVPHSQNRQADALSRKPEYAVSPQPEALSTILRPEHFAASSAPPCLLDRIRESQARDPVVRAHAQDDASSPYTLREGLLYHHGRLYVPAGPCRAEVLELCHDNRPAGHFGQYKTLHLLTREFWWPRVRAEVEQYVRTCPICHRAKDQPGKPAGLLQPLPTPSGPWKLVSMDFITDLPLSQGNTAILMVVDLFSKMAHFVPCPGVPTAQETARLFIGQIFRLHGLPEGIVSDRGPQFTARFWRSLLQQLDIKPHLSSAYHPQSDGQTERTNATLEQYLRCYTNYQQDNWGQLLPLAEFAYNNALHVSTQQTPFFANCGYHPRLFPSIAPQSSVPAADLWFQELQAAQMLLREQLDQAKQAYKRNADTRRQPGPPLTVGDRVWLSTRHLPHGRPNRKLDARFVGPFPIVAQVNPVAFRLQLPRNFRIHPVFHRSLLVPANEVRPDAGGAPPPPPVLVGSEEEFEVAQVLDSRRRRGHLQYLIDWVGYGPEERSWEDALAVHAPDLVRQFHEAYPCKPGPVEGRGMDAGRGSGVMPCPESESEEEEEEGPSGTGVPEQPGDWEMGEEETQQPQDQEGDELGDEAESNMPQQSSEPVARGLTFRADRQEKGSLRRSRRLYQKRQVIRKQLGAKPEP